MFSSRSDFAPQRYSAFISYRRTTEDSESAKRLEEALETYKVPKSLVKQGFVSKVGRVFRDQDELPVSSDLNKEIKTALENSNFLIVVCSPSTPQSTWVAREIDYFVSLGKVERIIPVLIRGDRDISFPSALNTLRNFRGELLDPILADLRPQRETGIGTKKQYAEAQRHDRLRIIAALIGCRFDDLRQRDAERKRKQNRRRAAITICSVSILLALVGLWVTWLAIFTTRPQFGPWEFTSGVGSKGTPYCAMGSSVVNMHVGQNIVIKGYKGKEKYFVVSLYKSDWNRPKGPGGDITFDFGDGQPLILPASGDGRFLETTIPTQILGIYLSIVAESPMAVVLPNGENEGWVIHPKGAKAALEGVAACMKD